MQPNLSKQTTQKGHRDNIYKNTISVVIQYN